MTHDLLGPIPKKAKYPKGYRDAPGGGPTGAKCKDCNHFYRLIMHKSVSKCDLVLRTSGTDISMHSPACRFFKERVECQS